MVNYWCLHRFWTSELQYEPSGAWLSLVMAEIRPISHWMSLAVNDLKITVSFEKWTFLMKCEHFLGQPKDLLFTQHHVLNMCTTKPGKSKGKYYF